MFVLPIVPPCMVTGPELVTVVEPGTAPAVRLLPVWGGGVGPCQLVIHSGMLPTALDTALLVILPPFKAPVFVAAALA